MSNTKTTAKQHQEQPSEQKQDKFTEHIDSIKDAFTPPDTGEITNCNITTSIGQEIDIPRLVNDVPWAATTREKTPSSQCGIAFENTPGAGSLYRTGTVVITGASTADDVREFLVRFDRELQRIGVNVEWGELNVTNLVVTFPFEDEFDDGRRVVDLPRAAGATDEIYYDPHSTSFSGAVYTNSDGKCLLFRNGSTVVPGVVSVDQAVERRRELFDTLAAYDLILDDR